MTAPKDVRVRTFGRKTRTGCLTCKQRRVKCDEARPSCNRCTKLWVVCQGYKTGEPRKSRTRMLSKDPVPISPRPPWLLRTTSAAPLVLSLGRPLAARFHNQTDYDYFQSFRERTACSLSGPFDQKLWEQVVPQACYEEPTLQALAAALGALDLSAGASVPTDTPRATARVTSTHQVYALDQYGKALIGVRNLAASQRPGSVRQVLIASILIYCFESMYGGVETAITHLEGAMRFLSTHLSHYSRSYQHSKRTSPTPNLEAELIAAFVRLDGTLLPRPQTFKSGRPQELIIRCDFSDVFIPSQFSDLDEARNCLEQAHFLQMPHLVQAWAAALSGRPNVISESSLAVLRQTSDAAQKWLVAFAPMFDLAVEARSQGRPYGAEFSLQIQGLVFSLSSQTIQVGAAGDVWGRHSLVRDIFADCDTINTLARQVVDEPGFLRTFVWENSILQALCAVMTIGPNLKARHDALEIMKSVRPRKENAWDSVVLAQIGDDLMGKGDVGPDPFHDDTLLEGFRSYCTSGEVSV